MNNVVRVLDPDFEDETGVVVKIINEDGYPPIARVKLDCNGQIIHCFLNELEVLE